jgi:pimeloyl-ACP methyl ester carboxylesterase
VVAPNHDAAEPTPDRAAELVATVMADVTWVHHQWSESKWVDQRPEQTAVVGHSFGACSAPVFAAAHPEVGAFVSLSGGFHQLTDGLAAFCRRSRRQLLHVGPGRQPDRAGLRGARRHLEVLDKLTQPRYAARFQGEH